MRRDVDQKTEMRKLNGLTNNQLVETKSKLGGTTFHIKTWDSDDDVLLPASSAADSDGILCIVPTCLPVATPSLCCGLHSLSGTYYRTLLGVESKHQAEVQTRAPCRASWGQRWKMIPQKAPEVVFFFAVVPPVDRNLRSRQECMRAWSWLSSTQISVLQQVCSDRPHSCSCLQLFVLSAFNTWPVATHEYLCSNSLHMPHHITLVCSVSCTKLKIPSCVAPNSTSFALDPGNPFPPCEFLVCSQ